MASLLFCTWIADVTCALFLSVHLSFTRSITLPRTHLLAHTLTPARVHSLYLLTRSHPHPIAHALDRRYDDNHIQIDGSTDLAFTEDVAARFEAYGWHVQTVATGDSADVSALRDAVSAAQGATDRPSLIKVQTTIGYGAAKQGTHDVHGAPIGAADIAKIKGEWGFDPASSFYVDPEVAAVFAECRAVGKKSYAAWSAMFARCDPSTLLALTALSLTLSVVL